MASKGNSLVEPVHIIDGLYLGDKSAAKNKEALQRLGISAIVNCTEPLSGGGVHNHFEGEGLFKYLRCPVQDSDGAQLAPFFESTAAFIDEARTDGYGVLVHCQMGISRSSTIVLSYLMQSQHMSLMDAYALVRTKRPEAKPKANFLRQLVELQERLAGGGKEQDSKDEGGQKRKSQDSEHASSDDAATPESNKQRRTLGPSLPPSASGDSSTNGKPQKTTLGPALPPHLRQKHQQDDVSVADKKVYGMALPPHLQNK